MEGDALDRSLQAFGCGAFRPGLLRDHRSDFQLTFFAAVKYFQLEPKARVRCHHTSQLLPCDGFAIDDQQGHLLEAIQVAGDLSTHHIIFGNLIAVAFGLDMLAAEFSSNALEQPLEGNEQVLFRVCDHCELADAGLR